MIFGVFIAMGLGLVVARQFSPTEAEAQASPGLVPEYELVDPVKGEQEEVLAQLNAYGAAGWEVQGARAVSAERLQIRKIRVHTAGNFETRQRPMLLLRRVTGCVKKR